MPGLRNRVSAPGAAWNNKQAQKSADKADQADQAEQPPGGEGQLLKSVPVPIYAQSA